MSRCSPWWQGQRQGQGTRAGASSGTLRGEPGGPEQQRVRGEPARPGRGQLPHGVRERSLRDADGVQLRRRRDRR
eukprot:14656496-Alexandrium_andersonii.AAC.1